MSVHHHNALYYDWWIATQQRCFVCDRRPAKVFHHFALVGSDKSLDLLPRRHSTYNAAFICVECHDKLHADEKRTIVEAFGSERRLYQRMLARHHAFMDWLTELASPAIVG